MITFIPYILITALVILLTILLWTRPRTYFNEYFNALSDITKLKEQLKQSEDRRIKERRQFHSQIGRLLGKIEELKSS